MGNSKSSSSPSGDVAAVSAAPSTVVKKAPAVKAPEGVRSLHFASAGGGPALNFSWIVLSANNDVVFYPSKEWARKIVHTRRGQGWWGVYPFDPEHVWPHTMWVGPWAYWTQDEQCQITVPLMFLMQEEARAFTVRVFSTGEMECESIFGESIVLNGPRLLNLLGVELPKLTVPALTDVNRRSDPQARGHIQWHVGPPYVNYMLLTLKRTYCSQQANDYYGDDDTVGQQVVVKPSSVGHRHHHVTYRPPADRYAEVQVWETRLEDAGGNVYDMNAQRKYNWHGDCEGLARGVYELTLWLRAPSSVRPTVLGRRQFVIGERELVPDDVLSGVQTIPTLVQLSLDCLLASRQLFTASGDGHSPELLNPTWQRCIDRLPAEACVAGFRASNLTSVRVYCADFPATTMDFLTSLPHLADLCFDGPDPAVLGDLALLARLTGLRRLAVRGACISCEDVLAAAAQLPQLRCLELAALVSDVVDVKLHGRQYLVKLAPRLHTLALVGFSNVQAVLTDGTDLASDTLLTLDVSHSHCGRRDSSPALLRRLRDAFPNLQQLNYSYNRLSPGQLAVVAELPALRHVNISHCHDKRLRGVDYEKCLGPLLAAPHLHTLVFYNKCHSPIDAMTIESAFAAAGKLAKATKLQWAYNPATHHYGVRRKSGKWPGTDIARLVPGPDGVEWSTLANYTLAKPADPGGFFWMPKTGEPDKNQEFRFSPLYAYSSIAYCPAHLLCSDARFHVVAPPSSASSSSADQV